MSHKEGVVTVVLFDYFIESQMGIALSYKPSYLVGPNLCKCAK